MKRVGERKRWKGESRGDEICVFEAVNVDWLRLTLYTVYHRIKHIKDMGH